MNLLFPFCKAFEGNPTDRVQKLPLLLQYFQSVESDPDSLSQLATDTHLKCVIQHIFSILLQEPFPSPSEGMIPTVFLQTLQHLTILCLNHPDILDAVAKEAPLDQLPITFFSKNISKDKIVDPQPSHLLTSVRFLATLCTSHSIAISSTASLHMLFAALFSLINVNQLSAYATATIAGLAHNSASALAFLKSLPNFNSLRQELAVLLSSADHSVVVSSLACMTALFIRDEDVLLKAAIRAVVSPPSFVLATTLATWSIRDIASCTPILKSDIGAIVQSLLSSAGMRALRIMTLLSEIQRMGYNLGAYLLREDLLRPILEYCITSKHDFVSAAGCQLLQALFETDQSLEFEGTNDIFARGLQIVMAPTGVHTLLKVESVLMLLKLMIRGNSADKKLKNLLAENEEPLFVAFQRHIEASHSFLAVAFFLFLARAASFNDAWLQRLQNLVAESHFSALLVHVLTHAENRPAIADAVDAAFLITQGIDVSSQAHILTDTLVSGFFVMNKRLKEEEAAMREKLSESINDVEKQQRLLIRQRQAGANEVGQLQAENAKLTKEMARKDAEIEKLSQQLKSEHELALKKKAKIELLRQAGDEQSIKSGEQNARIESLFQQLTELKEKNATQSAKIQELRVKEKNLIAVEGERDTLQTKLESSENEVSTLKKTIETLESSVGSERNSRRQTETSLYEMSSKASDLSLKLKDSESQLTAALNQIKRFEVIMAKKSERLTAYEEINRQLMAEVQDLQEKMAESSKAQKRYRKAAEALQAKLEEHENIKTKNEALYQFIHNLTEKAAHIETSEVTEASSVISYSSLSSNDQ